MRHGDILACLFVLEIHTNLLELLSLELTSNPSLALQYSVAQASTLATFSRFISTILIF